MAAAAERHQVFLWPDGTVDASWGLRVHSWTLWGSFGTYGPVAGLSLLGNEKKAWRRAAGRSLTYLSQCLAAENQGQELLGYGPHASLHSLKRDICIYPTVCTAVGLAIALNWGDLSGPVAPPPGKQEPFAKIFPSCQIAVVHTKGLYTTLSWSSRRRPAVFPPRGGAISHLHLAGFGTVQCASPSLFVRRERLQTPRQKNVLPLTPRIEIRGTDTWYANIFDTTTECEFEEKREESDQDLYQFSFRGSLCDPSGRSSGVRYRLKYRFGHHYLRKTLTVSRRSRSHAVVVREPFVPDVSWPQPATAANSVRFGTARNSFRIALESPSKGAILEHAGEQDRFYFPLLPSVRATPIEIRFTDPAVTKIRWILERL